MNLKLSEIFGRAQKVVVRYPLTLLMSAIMTVAAVYLIESDYNNKDTNFVATKILIVSALGISLSFALKMLTQRNPKFFWFEILLIPFLVGYYFILPAKENDFTDVYVFLLVPSYILAHLLVAVIPFLKKKNTEADFWEYNKKLFVNFFLTVVFTGVLCGGIELAILAVDNLFNMDFDGERYAETFFFFLIFGSSFIFALFNIEGLKELEQKVEYPVVLKFFTQFILIPLLIIYAVILYLYSFKILISWELPRGWVSYLVLAYSVLGILALLLVHPLKDQTEKSWVRLFSKIFYYSLIPLLVLLFVAIFTRVLEYGYTEARYFVLLLAVWLTVITLYFMFFKKPTIKFIPVSMFLFGLFALIFPFLNAFSVAKNSQKKDLMRILTENKLLVDGKINFNQTVKSDLIYEIEDKFEFLDQRHQRDYLMNLLPDDFPKADVADKYRSWFLRNKFTHITDTDGNKYEGRSNEIRINNSNNVFETAGFDFVYSGNLSGYNAERNLKVGKDNFKLKKSDENFALSFNDKESVNLMPQIKKFFEGKEPSYNSYESDDLSFETELENYSFKIIIGSMQMTKDQKSDSYYFYDFLILIKKPD